MLVTVLGVKFVELVNAIKFLLCLFFQHNCTEELIEGYTIVYI